MYVVFTCTHVFFTSRGCTIINSVLSLTHGIYLIVVVLILHAVDSRWSKCNCYRKAWNFWETFGNSWWKLFNSRLWLWRKWWILDSKWLYCNRLVLFCLVIWHVHSYLQGKVNLLELSTLNMWFGFWISFCWLIVIKTFRLQNSSRLLATAATLVILASYFSWKQ